MKALEYELSQESYKLSFHLLLYADSLWSCFEIWIAVCKRVMQKYNQETNSVEFSYG